MVDMVLVRKFDVARASVEVLFSKGDYGIPVHYENQDVGADVLSAQKSRQPWMRLSYKGESAERLGLGRNKVMREYGSVYVQLFVPAGYGKAGMHEIFDRIDPYMQADLSDSDVAAIKIRFGLSDMFNVSADVSETVAVGDDGGWYREDLRVPFRTEYGLV